MTPSLAHTCLQVAGQRAPAGIPRYLLSAEELNCVSGGGPWIWTADGETSLSSLTWDLGPMLRHKRAEDWTDSQ